MFSGHEHAYERIKLVENIYYFIQGSSGKLVRDDFHRADEMATSFDRDRTFMLIEIPETRFIFRRLPVLGKL